MNTHLHPRCPSVSDFPHGLWSLWDMLKKYALVYLMTGQMLEFPLAISKGKLIGLSKKIRIPLLATV